MVARRNSIATFISLRSVRWDSLLREKAGKDLNYNYYDSRALMESILDFVVRSWKQQLDFGIERDICYCLGTGKNSRYLSDLNKKHHFFGQVVPLEHPRFIMQYKSRSKQFYIESYLEKFRMIHKGKS